jgi:hypothetical protein
MRNKQSLSNDYNRATEITKRAGRDPDNEAERFKSVLEHILQFNNRGKMVRPLRKPDATDQK